MLEFRVATLLVTDVLIIKTFADRFELTNNLSAFELAVILPLIAATLAVMLVSAYAFAVARFAEIKPLTAVTFDETLAIALVIVVEKLASAPKAVASSFNVFNAAGADATKLETALSVYD